MATMHTSEANRTHKGGAARGMASREIMAIQDISQDEEGYENLDGPYINQVNYEVPRQ